MLLKTGAHLAECARRKEMVWFLGFKRRRGGTRLGNKLQKQRTAPSCALHAGTARGRHGRNILKFDHGGLGCRVWRICHVIGTPVPLIGLIHLKMELKLERISIEGVWFGCNPAVPLDCCGDGDSHPSIEPGRPSPSSLAFRPVLFSGQGTRPEGRWR